MTSHAQTTGGGHPAALGVIAGVGVLLAPLAAANSWLTSSGSLSLHEADHNVIMVSSTSTGRNPSRTIGATWRRLAHCRMAGALMHCEAGR